MKLLLDQNLFPSLIQALSGVYPGSVHVRDLGLASGTDQAVWERARAEGFGMSGRRHSRIPGATSCIT